jgi:putative transposase
MPRSARVIVPTVPHHVVQRGHNRSRVFAESADFNYYLQTLREWKITLGIKVYGYCLMTNHVHLILEPSDDAQVIGKLMRRLAGRQTRYVNRLEGRTGRHLTLLGIGDGPGPRSNLFRHVLNRRVAA